MLAVAFSESGRAGLAFRPATDADQEVFAQARHALAEAEAIHSDPFLPLVPDEPFPVVGALGMRPSLYGVRTWGQMFNVRQNLALVTFAGAIREMYEDMRRRGGNSGEATVVAVYLAYVLSRMALRNSEATRWANDRHTAQMATSGHRFSNALGLC